MSLEICLRTIIAEEIEKAIQKITAQQTPVAAPEAKSTAKRKKVQKVEAPVEVSAPVEEVSAPVETSDLILGTARYDLTDERKTLAQSLTQLGQTREDINEFLKTFVDPSLHSDSGMLMCIHPDMLPKVMDMAKAHFGV